jgi:acetolactate synthase I/II/III large subunit
MAGFELMTAVENDVPVIWVIFNDDEYKLVKLYQLVTYGEAGFVDSKTRTSPRARVCGGRLLREDDRGSSRMRSVRH